MLKYLLIYLIVGVVAIFLRALLHIIKAQIKYGVKIETMNSVLSRYNSSYLTPIKVLIGFVIWPIRILQCNCLENDLLHMYILAEKNQ